MNLARLQERIVEFLRAVHQLEKAVQQPKDEFIRDAVIQRFEFTHELSWKMLKLRLEVEDIFAQTPRETWQKSLQAGLIKDGNNWTDMQRMRNLTSHTYSEQLAEEVYNYVVQSGLKNFQELAEMAQTWKDYL